MLSVDATSYAGYRERLRRCLRAYRRRHFAGRGALFVRGIAGGLVLTGDAAHLNYFDPALYHALTCRPRAFRNLANARVLAISVFGTLARRDGLALLSQVPCDDGRPLLSAAEARHAALDLQRPPGVPNEPGPPVVDLWLTAPELRVTILPRLLERGLGPCPEPARGRCSGDYIPQAAGCVHTAQGAAYWQHLPAVAGWGADVDLHPCPMAAALTLARALLAAADPVPGNAAARCGTLLVYDARNPAWRPGSRADRLFSQLRQALPPATLLRRTTWQAIAAALAASDWYSDLVEYLQAKYGIGCKT